MSAHTAARLKRKPTAATREARSGTPGWVIWCPDFTYPPTSDEVQAMAWFREATSNGCPLHHEVRPVLIARGGEHFRYVNREEHTG